MERSLIVEPWYSGNNRQSARLSANHQRAVLSQSYGWCIHRWPWYMPRQFVWTRDP